MSLPSFAHHTVRIREAGKKTVHGNQVDDWSNPGAERTVRRCWCEPARTAEETENRSSVSSGWDVRLPPTAEVYADSRIRLPNGLDYQVIGEPARVPSASGGLDHIYLYVERWAG